jgi:hypothetical protein
MEFRLTNPNGSRQAFTLIEVLVAAAIGFLLLAGVLVVYLFSITSFASMANYSDMNRKSRYASDLISRDIRCSLSISSATTKQIALNEPDDVGASPTTYTYDSDAGTLIRWKNGETKLLLSGLDSLSFAFYLRPATNSIAAFEDYAIATPPTTAKLIGFQWACSRFVRALQSESESIEGGMVEIRNQ